MSDEVKNIEDAAAEAAPKSLAEKIGLKKLGDRVRGKKGPRAPVMTPELQVAKELYMQGRKMDEVIEMSNVSKSTFYKAHAAYDWKGERELRLLNANVIALKLKKSVASAMPIIPDTTEGWTEMMQKGDSKINAVIDSLSKLNRLLENVEQGYDNLASIMLALDEFVGWLQNDDIVNSETPGLLADLSRHLGRFSLYISKKYQK